jgi:hypothetical protein
MKKILFALSALIVCFVALPEIKKAVRQIVFEESIRATRRNFDERAVLDEASRHPHSGMTVAEAKEVRRKRSTSAQ